MLKYFGYKGKNHWGIATRRTGYYIDKNNQYIEKFILPAIRFIKVTDDDASEILESETGIEIIWWTFIFQIIHFEFKKIGG